MKRLAFLVVLCTAALLISSSLYAQRGMSGRGGGGFSSGRGGSGFRSAPSGGFRSAGPAGFRSGPGGFRSGPGVRTFSPAARPGGLAAFAPANRPFAARPFVPSRSFVRFNRGFGFHHFRHNRFGFFDSCFGCFSPFFGAGLFWGAPYYYPSYYGNYYPDYYGAPQPVVVNTDNGNSVALAAEVQRLTDEVGDLRDEENRRYYADRARAANSGSSLTAKEPAVATVFVFRDGRRISAQSYAIAGQTLWIFDEHAARKYQISDLDAANTEQANAANGVEFHVPATPTPH
ncbi:MAG TPA: hypothetical protein VFQ41_07515 [Candidatus Angelobacter sp.]|nr:hypothetical protein [Candidatus Angelobacter sp.]